MPLPAQYDAAARTLVADLQRIFGNRLRAVVAYGLREAAAANAPVHTLVLVERITFEDLAACLPATDGWQRSGLAVPLLLGLDEFTRTLDVFPLEYGEIIAEHVVLAGEPPFADAAVLDADVRRACELQAKSHLIHLREGLLESGGDPRRIARLIVDSAGAFRSLLMHIVRLDTKTRPASTEELAATTERTIGIPAPVVQEVLASPRAGTGIADPTALLTRYVAAVEDVWRYVDAWRRA